MIQRASKYLSLEYRKMLFNAMVLPYFDYCSHVWSKLTKGRRTILIKLHKRGCRMLLRVPQRTPTVDVLKELKWCTLEKRWEKNQACIMYKVLNGNCPEYMKNYFVEARHSHMQQTRHAKSRALRVVKIKNELARKTFKYSAAMQWNALPTQLRQMDSYDAFKRNYFKHVS